MNSTDLAIAAFFGFAVAAVPLGILYDQATKTAKAFETTARKALAQAAWDRGQRNAAIEAMDRAHLRTHELIASNIMLASANDELTAALHGRLHRDIEVEGRRN